MNPKVEVLKAFAALDIDDVREHAKLDDDLGMDSQDIISFRCELEQQLSATIPDGTITREMTVADVIKSVSVHVRKAANGDTKTGMQGALQEEITIAAPMRIVYERLHKMEHWPAHLSHVKAIEVIYDDGHYQEFYMTILGANQSEVRVRSIRKCEERQISFFQLEPPPFLAHHNGSWTFLETGSEQCKVIAAHEWQLGVNAPSIYPGDAFCPTEKIVDEVLRQHARLTLESWKSIIEEGEMIREHLLIRAPLPHVYNVFADLKHWRAALPDVLDVKLLYADGLHQEFLMTVERAGKPETIRGIRFLESERRIEMFQPDPPPGFQRMSGVWNFMELDNGTEVSATRSFQLRGADRQDAAEVSRRLRGFVKANLDLFRAYIENGLHQGG
ncbi:MAG TPA: SRPBCC family protein [Candidatus Angelobacter sp.]|nr:SRPBCC family protein [Candidatus Angelobacter sp.]